MERAHAGDSIPFYLLIWAALAALTLGTWFFSYSHLGDWSMVIALGFAVAKASLVGWFFMHLKNERATSRFAVLAAVVFILLLGALTLSDVATRMSPALPGRNGETRLGESPRE